MGEGGGREKKAVALFFVLVLVVPRFEGRMFGVIYEVGWFL